MKGENMLSPKYLFIAVTCLSLNSFAGTGPTYKGLYDCTFAKVQFEIAHNNMDVRYSLLLKWPNGTDQIVTDKEEELGPIGNDTGAFYWTTKDTMSDEMTFRTSLMEGWVPDEITAFVSGQWNTCALIERVTTKG